MTFDRVAPAQWSAEVEQAEAVPVGLFKAFPKSMSGQLAVSLIRVDKRHFGARVRVDTLAGVVVGDPTTVAEVTVITINEPTTTRDQGEVPPLFELPE